MNVYDFGRWQNLSQAFSPGQGAFFRNPGKESIELGFLGEEGPPEKLVRPTTRPQFYLVACGSVQPTRIEDFLTGPATDGDAVYRFSAGVWEVSLREGGAWVGFDPLLNQGDAMFIRLMPSP